jgi:predicted PurR-regulated permease PerM
LNGLERQVSEPTSEQKGRSRTLAGAENALRAAVVHLIGSLSGLVLEVTFVPFLVFFMLSEKQGVWHSTLQLFPVSRRTSVKETLEDLRDVLRDYLVGMSLMTLIVIAASSVFFWAMGLDYPILIAIVSGLLNMVPYFGAVLSWLPPFLIALAKLHSAGSYALIAGVLMAIHMLSNNLLAPALVGKKVRLNALSITIALLFWGWIWGGMGLLLAIPVTASLRVICDHTESWKPVGRWLSAE